MQKRLFEYQRFNKYYVQTAHSLEEMAALEMQELGASSVITDYRGLKIKSDKESIYRILYETRLATRIIAPLVSFDCHSEKYLYQQVGNIDWSSFLSTEESFAINSNVADSRIKNSLFAGQVMKDAIVDQFREKTGVRPDYNQKNPTVRFSLHIYRNRVEIGLDLSLTSLHKRGYRTQGAFAPLQETLAAAVIRYTKWDGEVPLIDPCCGSGTLLAEALMSFCRIPAGYFREKWGLSAMPDYDEKLFLKVKEQADSAIRPLPEGLIFGSDISWRAVDVCRANLDQLPGGERILVSKKDFRNIDLIENSVIVSNLPYGVRVGNENELAQFHNDFGDFLKNNCKGSTAFLLVGNKTLASQLRLRADRSRKFKNGDLEPLLIKLKLY